MAKKPSNDGSLQTTKQMLDELDALMDKMLSLPTNELDEAMPAVPLAKAPMVSAQLTVAPPVSPPPLPAPSYESFEADSEAIAEVEAPEHPPLNPPHLTRPAVEPRKARRVAPPEMPPLPNVEPLTNDYSPPSGLRELDPLLADIPGPASAPAPEWDFSLLLWINIQFDRVTLIIPGARLLHSQGGRTLLGLSGTLMTLAAAAWLLKDWLGWN